MKIITTFILMSLISTTSFSDCDWSTIKKLPDGGYEYTPTLNLCVGQLVQDSAVKDQQIQDLTKAISLKDLAISNSDARVALWQKSADDEQDRLNKVSSDQKMSEWCFFSLGVLTTFAAGYAAAKLAGR